MTSFPSKLAEPVRTTFLLVESPPAGQLPAVIADPGRCADAARALRIVEVDGEHLSRPLLHRSSFIRWALAGVVGLPALVGSAISIVNLGLSAIFDPTRISLPMIATPLAAAAIMGAGYALASSANRKNVARQEALLQERFATELALVENAMPAASSLERAWLARRAGIAQTAIVSRYTVCYVSDHGIPKPGEGQNLDAILERRFPGPETQPFAKRLASIAEQFAAVSDDDRAQVEAMQAIFDTVLARARRVDTWRPVNVDTTRGKAILETLESMIHAIEHLTPEARALLRPSIEEAVVRELSLDSGNRWRLKRFRESFEGKYTPYATGEAAIGETVTLEELRSVSSMDRDAVQKGASPAYLILMHQLSSGDQARVRVSTASEAEAVAAYFEQRDLRAVIYERNDSVVVTVYDPAKPPKDSFVHGS